MAIIIIMPHVRKLTAFGEPETAVAAEPTHTGGGITLGRGAATEPIQ